MELAGTNLSGGDKFGLRITSGGSTIRGLVINRFTERGGGIGYGLFLEQGGGNTIQGNFIGIDVSGASSPTVVGSRQGYGMMLEGSSDNLIGGPMPADRNVISGFLRRGIEFRVLQRLPFSSSANNRIQGNFVGTDRTGTSAVWPFGSDGISPGGGSNTSNLVGGPGPGEGNLISGTGGAGILLTQASLVTVQGNRIGTDVTGTSPLGNRGAGIYVIGVSDAISIGGAQPGEGNLIAYNGTSLNWSGVEINSSVGTVTILGNSIHSHPGLGIDLRASGDPISVVTPNDAEDQDAGPNNHQNFPVLTSAVLGSTHIQGTLDSAPDSTFTLELFSNTACDPSGHGEGETFLAVATTATDGSGNASFGVTLASDIPVGKFITATATDPSGNTSEFSRKFVSSSSPNAKTSSSSTKTEPVVGLMRRLMQRTMVDLPLPERPMTTKVSPSYTSKLTSCRATTQL